MNPYTVAVRPDGQDGCDFVKVNAVNAYVAQRKALKKYRKVNGLKSGKVIVYHEYTFAGHVEVLNNTYGLPIDDAKLKQL